MAEAIEDEERAWKEYQVAKEEADRRLQQAREAQTLIQSKEEAIEEAEEEENRWREEYEDCYVNAQKECASRTEMNFFLQNLDLAALPFAVLRLRIVKTLLNLPDWAAVKRLSQTQCTDVLTVLKNFGLCNNPEFIEFWNFSSLLRAKFGPNPVIYTSRLCTDEGRESTDDLHHRIATYLQIDPSDTTRPPPAPSSSKRRVMEPLLSPSPAKRARVLQDSSTSNIMPSKTNHSSNLFCSPSYDSVSNLLLLRTPSFPQVDSFVAYLQNLSAVEQADVLRQVAERIGSAPSMPTHKRR